MFLEKVKNTIISHGLIAKNDTLLVGVSGGPDSLALLYCLWSLKSFYNLRLHVVHLDHGLRLDSHKDAQFVKGLAKKLRLPITCARAKFKHQGAYPSEELTRKTRFEFLFKVAQKIKADKIALGHNRDDQAETVLMRILRGTGLLGLAGILPRRSINGFTLIRPLIEVSRNQIEEFLKKKRIKPRRDATNKKDLYFRNKVRNRLLPLLEKDYNNNIKETLARFSESAAYDYDFLLSCAVKAKKACGKKPKISALLRLHPSLRRIVFRLIIADLQGDTRRLSFQHIRETEDLLLKRPVNSIVNLPRGVCIIKKKKVLSFYLKAQTRGADDCCTAGLRTAGLRTAGLRTAGLHRGAGNLI